MERISTDIYGPFKLKDYDSNSLRETGYILSITDIYTRFSKLYFLEKISSNNVLEKIKTWFNKFTKPKYIISDNGKQFRNKKMKDFLKTNKMEQILVPEYTPSANGISERINKIITEMLIINKGKRINEILQETEFCINNNYNRMIKASPASKIYGLDLYNILNLPNKEEDKTTICNNTCKRFKVGDRVFKRIFNSEKLGPKYELVTKEITKVGDRGY